MAAGSPSYRRSLASRGRNAGDAMAKAEVPALRPMAERLEHGDVRPVRLRFYLAVDLASPRPL